MLSKLKPQFRIVGSIPEGSRIHKANELDVMCQFQTLIKEDFALVAKDAMTLIIEKQDHPLKEFCTDKTFRFEKFFQAYLDGLLQSLKAIESQLPKSVCIEKSQLCSNCISKQEQNQPFEPCTKCIFPLTHTKAGACFVLKWKDLSSYFSRSTIVTIDLVPVVPVKFENCTNVNDVFNLVTKTLLKKKPQNWIKHLKGIIRNDRILPEHFEELNEVKNEKQVFEVGLKLLHYGSENNYIVRPAQILNIVDFSGYPKGIKDVYCNMKYIKTALNVDIKSYFMKKVLIRNEFVARVESGGREIDHLFEAMSYPEIRKAFEKRIDYDRWREQMKYSSSEKGLPVKDWTGL